MFCKHEWEKIAEETLPSGLEQAQRPSNISNFGPWMVEKKYILTVACKKCGKLKTIVETNP